jgi:hypothetical protein
MAIPHPRLGLIAAAVILSLGGCAGTQGAGKQSERAVPKKAAVVSYPDLVILPARCAMAHARSINHLEKWYETRRGGDAPGFNEYYKRNFGSVLCSEKGGKITVVIRPKKFWTRRGVSFVIDKKTFKVIEQETGHTNFLPPAWDARK